VLLDAEGVIVEDVRCPGHGPGWSAGEPVTRFGVVFPRSGVFRRRVNGVESVIDTVSGYVQRPDSEQRIAHPKGGDRCTSITMSASAFESLVGDDRLSGGRADLAMAIDPSVDLRHRELVARARRGAEADELAERAMAMLGGVLSGLAPVAVRAFRLARRDAGVWSTRYGRRFTRSQTSACPSWPGGSDCRLST
jgi:hypothetical protein